MTKEKCPNCKSEDCNLYTDRFFCFSCKLNIPAENYLKIKQSLEESEKEK